jgi:hypothetical protein
VRLADETVWLPQQLIADLFQTTVPNISMHIRNIFQEGELRPEATIKKFLTVRREGKRDVQRNLDFFNLDMIISVGYRVKSRVATRFRIWATERLKEFIVKGQAMRRIPMAMDDWIKKLDAFLNVNDRDILTHAGKISHDMARQVAENEYDTFNRKRITEQDQQGNDFDALIKHLPDNKGGKSS